MKKPYLLLSGLVAGASTLSGQIVVDSFNYPTGTDLDSTLTGGTGWSGGYYSDTSLSNGTTDFAVTDYDWSLPNLPEGSFVMADKKSLDTTGSGSAYAGRGLSSGINFDADGALYLSYTMDTESGIGQELDFFSGTSEILSIQYLGGLNQLRMRSTDSSNSALTGATAGNDWFVVLKIETAATGDDIFRLNVFEAGDTVGATEGGWAVSHNGGSITGTVDQIGQWKYFDTGVGIGNLRMADSWEGAVGSASTVAVPEPSTYALMAGAVVLGMVAWRRRRRR